MRAVFRTCCAAILWRRIRRPHIVVRLATPIRSIFPRHRTVHVVPIVLRAIHVASWWLRTSHFAVHRAIVHTPVNSIIHTLINSIIHAPVNAIVHTLIDPIIDAPVNAIIHAMVAYRARDHIVAAEFSRARSSCDRRPAMIHRRQKFAVTARTMLVLDLHMCCFKMPLVHKSLIIT
jgi:hypothetical protein